MTLALRSWIVTWAGGGEDKERNKMTKEEALNMLERAPYSTMKSRVNPGLTQQQVVDIVTGAIANMQSGVTLDSLTEKRVWQVCKNQVRPNY